MARGMGALDDLIIGMTKLGDDGVAAAKPLANVNADTLQRVISTIAKNKPGGQQAGLFLHYLLCRGQAP